MSYSHLVKLHFACKCVFHLCVVTSCTSFPTRKCISYFSVEINIYFIVLPPKKCNWKIEFPEKKKSGFYFSPKSSSPSTTMMIMMVVVTMMTMATVGTWPSFGLLHASAETLILRAVEFSWVGPMFPLRDVNRGGAELSTAWKRRVLLPVVVPLRESACVNARTGEMQCGVKPPAFVFLFLTHKWKFTFWKNEYVSSWIYWKNTQNHLLKSQMQFYLTLITVQCAWNPPWSFTSISLKSLQIKKPDSWKLLGGGGGSSCLRLGRNRTI